MSTTVLDSAIGRLSELLKKTISSDETAAKIISSRDQVLGRYGPMFKAENLPQLTADGFREFLLIKNNQHWASLQRKGPLITADMDRLRRAIAILIDESRPVEDRLDELVPGKGPAFIPHLGKAILTPILLVHRPDRYGVWNQVSEGALKRLGLLPDMERSAGLGRQYGPINEIFRQVSAALGIDLWTLDALWWRVDGDSAEAPAVQQLDARALVARIRRRYPNWSGFQDAAFTRDELDYKHEAARKAQQLLSEAEVRRLLEAGAHDELIARIDRVGKLNNLLFLGVPRSGDLGALYRPELNKAVFCEKFLDLIYGEDDSPARLERWSQWADAWAPPNKWTLPTYFLFLLHPDEDLFVKPTAIKRFLELIRSPLRIGARPSGTVYTQLLDLADQLKTELAAYGPRNMIDIQSFIWVAGGEREEAASDGNYAASRRDGSAPERVGDKGGALFPAEAFELLSRLRQSPRATTYHEHEDGFERFVEQPMKELLRQVAARLPEKLKERLETEKNVQSRFLKNDYGRGAAWDFLWGAFYPKGGRRVEDAQLFVGINCDRLEFGFSIGEFAGTRRDRFARVLRENAGLLEAEMKPLLEAERLVYGRSDRIEAGQAGAENFRDWVSMIDELGPRVSVLVPAGEAMHLDLETVADRVAQALEGLFPLFLTASEGDVAGSLAALMSEADEPDAAAEYSLADMSAESGVAEAQLVTWVRAIARKKQAIFYGPPGTGKTYLAQKLARHLIGGGDGIIELVQFHPSYAYEDFIQGIRPRVGQQGSLMFDTVPGRFLEFCANAARRKDTCVLIIDEINRANLSRVFGELMFLLEYRDESVPLAGGRALRVPGNVRIIGTMNTADRSIALVDHAFRRRFAFLPLRPDYDVLLRFHERDGASDLGGKIVALLRDVNHAIDDSHYEIGISFFLRPALSECLEDIWRSEVEPYLEEYFFDQPSKVKELRWESVRSRVLG